MKTLLAGLVLTFSVSLAGRRCSLPHPRLPQTRIRPGRPRQRVSGRVYGTLRPSPVSSKGGQQRSVVTCISGDRNIGLHGLLIPLLHRPLPRGEGASGSGSMSGKWIA